MWPVGGGWVDLKNRGFMGLFGPLGLFVVVKRFRFLGGLLFSYFFLCLCVSCGVGGFGLISFRLVFCVSFRSDRGVCFTTRFNLKFTTAWKTAVATLISINLKPPKTS